MGIKHKTPKVPGEKGLAIEWNEEHLIDSDINFAGHSGVNLGEPISPTDIATKNYVDVMAEGVPGAGKHIESGIGTTNSLGILTVTFANEFSSNPVVVCTAQSLYDSAVCHIEALSTTGFTVDAVVNLVVPVHWIAMDAD